jgi:hypothetical protein
LTRQRLEDATNVGSGEVVAFEEQWRVMFKAMLLPSS